MLVDYRKVNIYQDEELILKDVDWNIDEGQFVYVIGKVGSGKSSLLKTLYCELDIYSDEAEKAEVLERDVIHIKRKEIPALRREMGIIFQDFQLLHDRTVYSNLRFVLKSTGWKNNDDIDNRITEVLEKVGMEDKKDKRPHELSGGEQQRIAIARALLNTPKIIIADEPTGNLDGKAGREVLTLLRTVSRELGITLVLVTHDMTVAEQADRIIRLRDGQIEHDSGVI